MQIQNLASITQKYSQFPTALSSDFLIRSYSLFQANFEQSVNLAQRSSGQ